MRRLSRLPGTMPVTFPDAFLTFRWQRDERMKGLTDGRKKANGTKCDRLRSVLTGYLEEKREERERERGKEGDWSTESCRARSS